METWAETPFGAMQRQEGLSHAINWIDCQGFIWNLGLLNKGLTNFEVIGSDLWLTLWRGLSLFADCAGCLPRDQRQPLIEAGRYEFHFALLPHEKNWRDCQLVQFGLSFNQPLQAVLTDSHPGTLPAAQSWLSIKPSTIIVSTVKIAESGKGLVVRLYESVGQATQALLQLPEQTESYQETNLLEEALAETTPIHNENISLSFRPFEIKTLSIKRKSNGQPG